MSLLFSRKCEYAIRSVIYLVRKGEAVSVSTLASELKIPRAFTGKILQELHRAGFLHSFPGSKGGYALAKSPDKLSLSDVIMIMDGVPVHRQCILGQSDCSDTNPCPLHGWWKGISSEITEQLDRPLSSYR